MGKYFRSGSFVRPETVVCELPEAVLHVGTGLVCTRNFRVLPDFEYRLPHNFPFGKRIPTALDRLTGIYSSIQFWNSSNYSHWMFDCLPKLHSLAKTRPSEALTIIMPDTLGKVMRESLELVLPAHFTVQFQPANKWLRLEKFLWPSPICGRANFLLPAEYYESMRRPIFARYGLSPHHHQTARIFVTRRNASIRNMLNETAVAELLSQYGFECVEGSELSFRQQVEIFHRADIVIGAHGAGLSSILFSGKIRVVVLHATQVPQNHYHTLAKGLGSEHYYMLHDGSEDDDFTVDLSRLEKLLEEELGLTKTSGSIQNVANNALRPRA